MNAIQLRKETQLVGDRPCLLYKMSQTIANPFAFLFAGRCSLGHVPEELCAYCVFRGSELWWLEQYRPLVHGRYSVDTLLFAWYVCNHLPGLQVSNCVQGLMRRYTCK